MAQTQDSHQGSLRRHIPMVIDSLLCAVMAGAKNFESCERCDGPWVRGIDFQHQEACHYFADERVQAELDAERHLRGEVSFARDASPSEEELAVWFGLPMITAQYVAPGQPTPVGRHQRMYIEFREEERFRIRIDQYDLTGDPVRE